MDNTIERYNGQERRNSPFCPHEKTISDLDHAVNGNGQEGIRTRIVRIEEKLDNLISGKPKWYSIINIIISVAVLVVMIITITGC